MCDDMENSVDNGHFRIMFLGYRALGPAPAWEGASDEDGMAYFQADISWINLGNGGVPQASVLTAMITVDVRGLRKFPDREESRSSTAGGLPLSLGTYALAAERNAVAIGNPAVLGNISADPATARGWSVSRDGGGSARAVTAARAEPGGGTRFSRTADTCRLDLPLGKPTRSRVLFLDFATARDLAAMDRIDRL